MDFDLSADQRELQALTRRIVADTVTPERMKAVAATEAAVDLDLWRTMAVAGLVGIAMPTAAGGGGLGFLDACVVLEEVAAAAAPVPGLAVLGLAGPALASRPDLLDGVASGERVVTAALTEALGDPWQPATEYADGRVTGTKICVPSGLLASAFVVSTGDGLCLVERGADGVTVERQDTTSGTPEARLVMVGAPAELLGGRHALASLLDHAVAAACVMTAGVTAAALRLTAEYARTRTQFDRPIASFQAVSQRAADAYIDHEAVRLTAWQAAWRLSAGLPATEALLTAKFWAAEGGQRVVYAAQHLHGGVGVDRDYPLHRHFLAAKQLELLLGSATPSLQRLGRRLADTPV